MSNFKRAVACSLVLLGASSLGACKWLGLGAVGGCHKPGAYVAAKDAPPLKIPPGLKAPDTTQALRVPELNEPAPPPRRKGDPCLDSPPQYSIPKAAPPPAA